MKGKIKVIPIILGILIVITVLLSFKMFRQTMEYDDKNRVEFGDLYPVQIDGMYSEEGGPWKPLTRETEFDILSYRDITVRGHFNRDVQKGEKLFLKIELVHAALRVNGQELLNISRDAENGNPFKARGYFWVAVESPGITTEDTVELNLEYEGGGRTGAAEGCPPAGRGNSGNRPGVFRSHPVSAHWRAVMYSASNSGGCKVSMAWAGHTFLGSVVLDALTGVGLCLSLAGFFGRPICSIYPGDRHIRDFIYLQQCFRMAEKGHAHLPLQSVGGADQRYCYVSGGNRGYL